MRWRIQWGLGDSITLVREQLDAAKEKLKKEMENRRAEKERNETELDAANKELYAWFFWNSFWLHLIAQWAAKIPFFLVVLISLY